jgi:predicted transcriptional regulator
MKRVTLFLILLITSIAALIAATTIGFAIFSSTNQTDPYSWMGQMWGSASSNNNGHMGGMMSQTPTPTTTASSMLPYYGVLFAVLIAVTIVSVIGVSYYLVYPQIRMGVAATAPTASLTQTHTINTTNSASAYESVSKTLTEDERKIITVLQTHNGKYLQKYVKAETGLSRLQTHRILARLADRGIVSLEKTGNTNQVALADWLNQKH